ncbi:MAG TPA: polysaccharide deacetylase family protein [Anaerolineales bacterium]
MYSRRDFLKLTGASVLAATFGADLGRFDAYERRVAAQAADSAPVIWHGSTRRRYVALTYDDCYLVKRMQDLEELLAEFPEFKITLFPVGVALVSNEVKDPGIWKRFHENGHEIGYHSWDHTNIGVMSPEGALADYDRWAEALVDVLGFQPTIRFGRPPFGVLSYSFDVLCRERKLVNTIWSTGWGGELQVGLNAARNSRNGDIVLMHIRTQDYNTSLQAYPWMRENGWGAVTLTKLYDDLLLENNESDGCGVDAGPSLTRTCIE